MELYEVETINPFGGTDFFCGKYNSEAEALKEFENDLLRDGYKIIRVFKV